MTTPDKSTVSNDMTTRHTAGQLFLEDKTQSGAGLQIKGIIGEPGSRREFAEFKLRADVPVPLFLVAYDQWMQFPNPEWNEMQKANARRLVACWNVLVGIPTEAIKRVSRIQVPGITLSTGVHEIVEQHQALAGALKEALDVIEDYLNYQHSGDPYEEDARAMGEMGIDEYKRSGAFDKARSLIERLK